jgi:1-acyl-sn-glycerol-3-phosphate acyltransferase
VKLPVSIRRPRLPFPLGAPTTPYGVEPLPDEPTLGVHYDPPGARRGPARHARGAVIEYVMGPLVEGLAAPEVDGADRIEDVDAPVIFAANHHSHLDTPLLLTTLPARFRHRCAVAAAADYFFDSRVKSAMSAFAMCAIPIERNRISRRSADLAAQLLDAGWNLVIFPEGGRSPDGWGQDFQGGAAYLSERCGRPVVPVHLEGTRRILRKGAKRPTPSTVHVTFGAPMRADESENARRFAQRIERTVAALADEQSSDWWMARKRAWAGVTPELKGPTGSIGAWRRAWALGDERRKRRERVWP